MPDADPNAPLELFLDEPQAGPWNMAVDEALLERGVREGVGSLRLYRWSEPTLSLGYFQTLESRQEHLASLDCTLVRRLSGGGAIMHDREWTYSLVIPARHRLAREPLNLYDTIHRGVIDMLCRWGVEAAQVQANETTPDPQAFLCFQRRAAGDVHLPHRNAKILGSAQRRRRGVILQHGSLLLERSQAAPELAGLRDLAQLPVSDHEFVHKWVAMFAQSFKITEPVEALPAQVLADAQELERERYLNPTWNARR